MDWEKVIASLTESANYCGLQVALDRLEPDKEAAEKARMVILVTQGVFLGLAEALEAGLQKPTGGH